MLMVEHLPQVQILECKWHVPVAWKLEVPGQISTDEVGFSDQRITFGVYGLSFCTSVG